MTPEVTVHVAIGFSVIGLNGLAGLLGAVAWLRDRPSVGFWYLLRLAQLSVVTQALVGGYLLMTGHVEPDGLHLLYGLLPVPVAVLAEAARAGAAHQEIGDRDFESLPPERQRRLALAIVRRETGIMAISCLVILFLALRAAGVGSPFELFA